MDQEARTKYLTAQVMTASPERLRLMLIDAALRSVDRARDHWDDSDRGELWEAMAKAQEIVTELIAGINREANPELGARITAIYVFIFRSLVQGLAERNSQKIEDAARVLRAERETWVAVCEQNTASGDTNASAPQDPAGGVIGEVSSPVTSSLSAPGVPPVSPSTATRPMTSYPQPLGLSPIRPGSTLPVGQTPFMPLPSLATETPAAQPTFDTTEDPLGIAPLPGSIPETSYPTPAYPGMYPVRSPLPPPLGQTPTGAFPTNTLADGTNIDSVGERQPDTAPMPTDLTA